MTAQNHPQILRQRAVKRLRDLVRTELSVEEQMAVNGFFLVLDPDTGRVAWKHFVDEDQTINQALRPGGE